MSMYIVTGCYTPKAIKALIAHPSDREAAGRELVEAAGGKMRSFLITTGETDFNMVVETDDIGGLMSGLMVAGASETVCNLKTVQAFTSVEFQTAQKRAGKLAEAYAPAG